MPPRGPLTRFVARLLILALVAFSFPHELWASRAAFDARASNDLPEASSRRAGTVLILVPVGRCDRATTPLGRVSADHIGSVRHLTDESGAVTDVYSTTAFGELISHTGTDPQPYLFAGEPYDPNVGFAYHRARWMDPRVGRFVGTDPWPGLAFDPPSLHRYMYAANRPTDNRDPSGQLTLPGVLTVGAIIGTIAGIAVGVTLANFRGLTITEREFWYWVGGGAIVGAVVGLIGSWALIKFGVISVAYAGTAAPAINWLASNSERAWHIVRPDHQWERIANLPAPNTAANALTNYQAILPILDRITATTAPRLVPLANGAQKLMYEAALGTHQVVVRVWLSPTGQRIIEDAWVVR